MCKGKRALYWVELVLPVQYFCLVSINKRIPQQGHWITAMPFGPDVKIRRSVHSNPESVIVCFKASVDSSHSARISGEAAVCRAAGRLLLAGWYPAARRIRPSSRQIQNHTGS